MRQIGKLRPLKRIRSLEFPRECVKSRSEVIELLNDSCLLSIKGVRMNQRLVILMVCFVGSLPLLEGLSHASLPQRDVEVIYHDPGGGGSGGGPYYDPITGRCSGARVTGSPAPPSRGYAIKIMLTVQSDCTLLVEREIIPANLVPGAPAGYETDHLPTVTTTVTLSESGSATGPDPDANCSSTESCTTVVVQEYKDDLGTPINYLRTTHQYTKNVQTSSSDPVTWKFVAKTEASQFALWSRGAITRQVDQSCGSASDPCSHLNAFVTFTYDPAPDIFINYNSSDHHLYPSRPSWTCRWQYEYRTSLRFWKNVSYCGTEA